MANRQFLKLHKKPIGEEETLIGFLDYDDIAGVMDLRYVTGMNPDNPKGYQTQVTLKNETKWYTSRTVETIYQDIERSHAND